EAAPAQPATEEAAPADSAAETIADDGYFSLEQVEGDIRRKLATEKLQAEIDEIYNELAAYSKTLSHIRANVAKKSDLKEVDIRQMAVDHGFDFMETTQNKGEETVPMLISFEEARLLDILPESSLQEVYASVPVAYSPIKTELIDDAIYLYRTTAVKAEHLPEYDEVKDLVLETWKIQEAIKLAMQDAQTLVDNVRTQNKPLSEVVSQSPKAEFVSTQKFSWFDFSRSFRNPSLEFGEIREEGVAYGESEKKNKAIIAPGKEFYEKADKLNVNEIDVAYNQPKDRVFVLQITEKDPDDVIMTQLDNMDQLGYQAQTQANQLKNLDFHRDWIESLKKDAGFEWIVIPRDLND
ncbi:MAG: hypothetical protein Q4C95_07170, partial [Planctomycetia bacterium]|nr:hypothetical protein [Planctomycetia bacterium]